MTEDLSDGRTIPCRRSKRPLTVAHRSGASLLPFYLSRSDGLEMAVLDSTAALAATCHCVWSPIFALIHRQTTLAGEIDFGADAIGFGFAIDGNGGGHIL
jgi:hypothetical protein